MFFPESRRSGSESRSLCVGRYSVKNRDKTKVQLIMELAKMQDRISDLEIHEAQLKRVEGRNESPTARCAVSPARMLEPSSLESALKRLKALLSTTPCDSSPQQAGGIIARLSKV